MLRWSVTACGDGVLCGCILVFPKTKIEIENTALNPDRGCFLFE
tara:strand:- start:1007 stop:1138 length:132 start_codon:yes stop_codon:yes gene_type:complete